MKIFRKTVLFIGSGLIVIGVILVILGFAFGGRLNISSWIGKANSSGTVAIGERIDVKTTYENVESIVINYRAGSLQIKEGDSFRIEALNVSKDRFESTVKDGVWTVSDKKGGILTFLDDISFGVNDSTVTLYIPKSASLTDCNFEIGAGKIEVDRLDTKQLTVKVGAGELIVHNLDAAYVTLNSGVGSMSIDGAISKDSNIDCGVGSISLSLKGDPDLYNYKIKVGLGKTAINGNVYSGISDKQITHDNATGTFDLDCGIGEINLSITP